MRAMMLPALLLAYSTPLAISGMRLLAWFLNYKEPYGMEAHKKISGN